MPRVVELRINAAQIEGNVQEREGGRTTMVQYRIGRLDTVGVFHPWPASVDAYLADGPQVTPPMLPPLKSVSVPTPDGTTRDAIAFQVTRALIKAVLDAEGLSLAEGDKVLLTDGAGTTEL